VYSLGALFFPQFTGFFVIFSAKPKQDSGQSRIEGMRSLRMLKPDGWYEIRTAVNNRKPLFRRRRARALFAGVLGEAKNRFVFEIRGLRLGDDLLTFYIRPADGFELPWILKWIKQTFAVRYNFLTGRTGHVWGDRYWSVILDGEPPEGEYGQGREAESEPLARPERGVRPHPVEMAIIAKFYPIFPPTPAPLPP
jgi:hypothetical protein